MALRQRLGDPGVEPLEARHGLVARVVERQVLDGGLRGEDGRAHAVGRRRARLRRLARRLRRGLRRGRLGPRALPVGDRDLAGLDLVRVHAGGGADAAGDGGELHRLEEGQQPLRVGILHAELVERHVEIHAAVELDELARDARELGVLDQVLPALGLLDLLGVRQEVLQVAIFEDELRRRLHADAGHARHVVDRIARQRLHVAHEARLDAELLDHLRHADALVLHLVVHLDAVADELHQVLVGGHDRHRRARLARLAGIGRDQVVGLEALLLDAVHGEGAGRVADDLELRPQILRRLRPVRLVVGVDLVAERDGRVVEDHREMGRRLAVGLAQQLPQHVAEAVHGPDRQAVRLARQRRQGVVGAEDVGGAVDEVDVVAGLDGTLLGIGHGRNMPSPAP